jgi:hypothetical protein
MINGNNVIESAPDNGLMAPTDPDDTLKLIKSTSNHKLLGEFRDAGYLINSNDTFIGSMGAVIVDLVKRVRKLEDEAKK